MKKIFLLFVLCIFYSTLSLAQTATATIPNVTVNPNTDVSIPINVENFNNVGAINLVINYDPNVLTFQSVPDSLPGFWILNSLIGQIRIGWFNTTAINKNNEALININFHYLGGSSNIEFDNTGNQIGDISANIINTTFNNGSISPIVIIATSSIGDYVWNDLDSNGVQLDKTLEPPLENVIVKLFDADSGSNGTGVPLQIDTTDSNGEYLFSNLTAGNYKVKIEILDGYKFSAKHSDNLTSPDGDSDVDVITGMTDIITLADSQQIYGIDAGMIKQPIITGIDDNTIAPNKFELSQNYPNPFNPSTKIEFKVSKTENISLIVYNILGQQVKVLVNRELNAGVHTVNFNALGLASGIYIYKLLGSSVNLTKKMILMK